MTDGGTFQVDLRGMVDLLARHLYSGPRVYLRELLQNAVDAITARRLHDPSSPASVRIEVGRDGRLEIHDTGIGLSLEQASDLLATIGRSSKRAGELDLGRSGYIGQFGIGMLAAFMVADTIEVTSMAEGEDPIRWTGHDNGTFELERVVDSRPVGSTIRLTPRPDQAHWLSTATVTTLAKEFGELLPVDVQVIVPVAGEEPLARRVTRDRLPWQSDSSDEARYQELVRYCEETFGFIPLDVVDLDVPLAGLSGVAFILPVAVSPGSGRHRVYVKRMLLGDRVDDLLPEWAFFARAVVNADGLNPTASREQLHTDEVLLATREALALGLRHWAATTLREPGERRRRILSTHHLSLRALALSDDDMLDLVAEVLPYETTEGMASLTEVAAASGEVLYCATTEAYQRIATVARAQGLTVVNAGYVYDATVMDRLRSRPGWRVRELKADDLAQVLLPVEPVRELELLDALARAREVLAEEDCDVEVRSYQPAATPAVLLRDAEGERQRRLATEQQLAESAWSEVLATFSRPATSRRLILNDASPLASRLLGVGSGEVFAAGIRALYLSAVLMAGDGLRGSEVASLNETIGVLLDAGLTRGRDDQDG